VRSLTGKQARGVELHHLDVVQRQPRTQRHREPVARLDADGVW
jgi:hypothetical protein